MARTQTASESTALAAKHARSHVRVEVHDGGPSGGTWVDLTNQLHGFDFGTDVNQTVIGGTVTFLRSHTDTADTLSPLVTDAVDSKRGIRIYFTTLPIGTTPASEDYRLVFDGIIDRVSAGGALMQCTVRDRIGAILADRDLVQEIRIFFTPGGTSLETLLDVILFTAALNNGENVGLNHDIPTDFTTSGVAIGDGDALPVIEALKIEPGKVLEAVRGVADRIGWQLRPRWNEGDQEFQLAFYAPPHDKTTVDWTLAPNRYLDVPQLDIDGSEVVNAWRVSYVSLEEIDPGSPTPEYIRKVWPEGDSIPPGYPVHVLVDEDSVARYGFRFGELAYEEHDPIRTEEDAEAVATIALAETAEPLVDAVSEHLMNWAVDIDDRVTLGADGVRFTSDQTWAVVGYRHQFGPNIERTTLQLRGKPIGGSKRWRNPPRAPAFVQPPSDLDLQFVYTDEILSNSGGVIMLLPSMRVTWTPSPDAFLSHYELQYRDSIAVDAEWQSVPNPAKEDIAAIIAGIGFLQIDVRLRAVNTRGAKSAWVTVSDTNVGIFSMADAGLYDVRMIEGEDSVEIVGKIGAKVFWIFVYEKTVLADAEIDPNPNAGNLVTAIDVSTITPVDGVKHFSHTVQRPPVLYVTHIQLEPRYEDVSAVGPVVRLKVNGPSPVPPTLTFREVSVALGKGDVQITVRDPDVNGAGVLSVWVNHDGDADPSPATVVDGSIAVASTPHTVLHTDDFTTGAGIVELLNDIKKPLSREKVIYAEFVTPDGRTTGIVPYKLSSALAELTEHLGAQTAESVVNWVEWADEFGLAPISRKADFDAIQAIENPRLNQHAVAHNTGVQYYWDGDSWEVDTETPLVQYAPALSAGIIEVEYLAASVGEFIDVFVSGELTAYDVTVQGQFTAVNADIATLEADVATIESLYVTEAEVATLLVSNTLSIGVFGGIGFAISSGGATATSLGVFSSSTGGPLTVGVACDGPMSAAWFEGTFYGTLHGSADEAATVTGFGTVGFTVGGVNYECVGNVV